jgi:hypothetical protein
VQRIEPTAGVTFGCDIHRMYFVGHDRLLGGRNIRASRSVGVTLRVSMSSITVENVGSCMALSILGAPALSDAQREDWFTKRGQHLLRLGVD